MCKQGINLVVSDAGPLIGLARAGHLTILTRLFKDVMIPPVVLTELHIDSDRPGAAALSRAISEEKIRMVDVHEVPSRLKKTLDEGEAEAIVLAIDQQAILLIDERLGRLSARQEGVPVIGTGSVLVKAKEKKIITSLKPVLQDLRDCGYRLSDSLCDEILRLANER